MRYIYHPSTVPSFNLAAEEWLLRNSTDDIFMLWRNAPAVIVGKNQNTGAEINQDFVTERDIKVIRRMTGGGAVFHDLGNVNYTFIHMGKPEHGIDFKRFTGPILEALRDMGVACDFDGRNDLVIDGLKFSGTAQLIEKDRVLHHGTLLFASEMADISAALNVNPVKYIDKSVKSVRKRVTNISSHLPQQMDVHEFIRQIMGRIAHTQSLDELDLAPHEYAGIQALADEKYTTWEWNYGASPTYGFNQATRTPAGLVEIHLNAEAGIIKDIKIFGDFFGVLPADDLARQIVGCAHSPQAVLERLQTLPVGQHIHGIDAETLAKCFF